MSLDFVWQYLDQTYVTIINGFVMSLFLV